MGNLSIKIDKSNLADNVALANGSNEPFVLSDVSKKELSKRRISVYSYLL